MWPKVLTLDEHAFIAECNRLEKAVMDDGFTPDCVLSIANGGIFVGNNIFKHTPHYSTKIQRPSTPRKKGLTRYLKRLPQPVLNLMRILESAALSARHTHYKECNRSIAIPDMSGFKNILIVDDAIDSGTTMLSVNRIVKSTYPDANIRNAVITVTTSTPFIAPDYSLHKQILIRFPWSMDA